MASHTIDSFIFIIEAHLKKKKKVLFIFLISSVYHLAIRAETHEYLSQCAKCTFMLHVWHMADRICLRTSLVQNWL